MEWGNDDTRWMRWRRHIAREHFNWLCVHPDDRRLRPLCRIVMGWLFTQIARAVRGRMRGRARKLKRANMQSLSVGRATLIHDSRTGEAHMLNEFTTRLWQLAEAPRRPEDLFLQMRREGFPEDKISEALLALRSKNLLIESND